MSQSVVNISGIDINILRLFFSHWNLILKGKRDYPQTIVSKMFFLQLGVSYEHNNHLRNLLRNREPTPRGSASVGLEWGFPMIMTHSKVWNHW